MNNFNINKYLEKITYFFIAALFFAGYLKQSPLFYTVAMYAFSGAITNSLAIIMIFDKIPGIYGSGIIEKNFEGFKVKLKSVLIEHFFKNGLSFDSIDSSVVGSKLYNHIKNSDFSILTQFMSEEKVVSLVEGVNISEILTESVDLEHIDKHLEKQMESMSPSEVKNLILHIMHEHLQYLVVWGGIIGAVMGGFAYHFI